MSKDIFQKYNLPKYFRSIGIAVIACLLSGIIISPSYAIPGLGSAARKGFQEAIEYTAKKFGINLADEGGKLFAREASEFIGRYGEDGIRALKGPGPDIIQLSSRYGGEPVKLCAAHSADAVGYLAKNMDQALPVWRQFGKEGTELMLKHPGLANSLLKKFGQKGLQIGKTLSTSDLNRFLVLASKAAGRKGKTALLDKTLKEGDKVIEFLWRHKWKIGAGATLYTLLKDYDNKFVSTGRDGEEKIDAGNQPHNFIEYFIIDTWHKILKEYPWLPLVIIVLVVVWMWPLFDWILRLPDRVRNLFMRLKSIFQRPTDYSHEEEKSTTAKCPT